MKKENLLKVIIPVGVIVIVIALVAFLIINNKQKLTGNDGGDTQNAHNLIGSSANYESIPYLPVFANSTTTDDSNASNQLLDGGATIYQKVDTSGADWVYLDVHAKGGTATSTLFIRQMASFDGTNYSSFATSTIFADTYDFIVTATSTLSNVPANTVAYDPGTSSTTDGVLIPFKTNGAKYTRFILSAEDLSTDPDDGVQAWIRAIIPENFN